MTPRHHGADVEARRKALGIQRHEAPERARDDARKRGDTWRWQKARDTYLAQHPICVECERKGRIVAATVVDHIAPHRGDQTLFWDRDNWQARWASCHNAKSARGE